MNKLIIGLLAVVVLGAWTSKTQGYKVGDKVESFQLKGVDNKMHSMEDYTDAKGYIIIFTCNHCPYSVAYEDRIIALNNKYAALNYPVIAINPNDPDLYPSDNFKNMKIRAKEKGFTFPYLMDKGQHIYPKFGATKTPHVFLLDANKVVQYIGAIDNSTDASGVTEKYLENAIEALRSGKKPTPNYTKAIGCSIKTKKK